MQLTARFSRARLKGLGRGIRQHWVIYALLAYPIVYLIVVKYAPMYGVIISFKNYKPVTGVLNSQWSGLFQFERLVTQLSFWNYVRNTVVLSLYSLIAGFPVPVILALMLNSCKLGFLKRSAQTVTYLPHFISTVVLVGMINVFFSPETGMISRLLNATGLIDGSLMTLLSENAFPHLYVWSGVWQNMGWDSIIYLAALSSVDPSLHEAALVDGANKLKRVWHIDLPCIVPTIVTLLILRSGTVLDVGFEKVYLMQNSVNSDVSEVISTYVYKQGLLSTQYSYSTAIGLANSLINMILLITVDRGAKALGQSGIF